MCSPGVELQSSTRLSRDGRGFFVASLQVPQHELSHFISFTNVEGSVIQFAYHINRSVRVQEHPRYIEAF